MGFKTDPRRGLRALYHFSIPMNTNVAICRLPIRLRPSNRTARVDRILGATAASMLSLFAIPDSASAGLVSPPAAYWLGGTDGKWTGNVNNWASDATGTPTSAIPIGTNDITFSATGATHQSTTLERDFTIRSLTISDPLGVTINSGTGGPHRLTLAGNASQGLIVQSGAGLTTIGTNLTLSGLTGTFTVNNTAGAVIRGSLGGAFANGTHGFIKEGTGTVTLAGPSTYTVNLRMDFGEQFQAFTNTMKDDILTAVDGEFAQMRAQFNGAMDAFGFGRSAAPGADVMVNQQ